MRAEREVLGPPGDRLGYARGADLLGCAGIVLRAI